MSQPTCAVCLRPITKADKFVLASTEVVHLACVKERGTEQSVVNRLKARVVHWQGEARHAATRALALENEISASRGYHERVIAAERDVARLTLQLAESGTREAEYRRQRDEARRERDEARAARDAATRELQLHQTLAGARSGQAAATSTDPPAKDQTLEESQATRFGLLELD